jgi:cyclopropane-fatty-acyl-phospholipid synthase
MSDKATNWVKQYVIERMGLREMSGVCLSFWDGSRYEPKGGFACTLHVRTPTALYTLLAEPSPLRLSQEFIVGNLDVSGDLEAVMTFSDEVMSFEIGTVDRVKLAYHLSRMPRDGRRMPRIGPHLDGPVGSRERVREAIRYHYDLPAAFWSAWLDPYMQYTCGYFESEEEDLDPAQERKLERICRKLGLRSGQRLLDIGCGWGGLMSYVLQHYDVEIIGITLSESQADHARQTLERHDLPRRWRVEITDFRDAGHLGEFDAITGVGVMEHIGSALIEDYFASVKAALHPGGRFLNQAIGTCARLDLRNGHSFMDTYIFPDTEVIPIARTLDVGERTGLEVRDVENLREHYVHTLRNWRRRLEMRSDRIVELVGEEMYRAFRLYLGACAHDFAVGRLAIYQSVFENPPARSVRPRTRII